MAILPLLIGKTDGVENGLGYKVVTSLVSQYKHQGYTIYMDYFYSLPALFKDLIQSGFNACGTLRTNRKGITERFKNKTRSTGKITICSHLIIILK